MKKIDNSKHFERRKFIQKSAIAAGGLVVAPSILASCDDDDAGITFIGDFGFMEGIGSFDPSQDGVVLWSRYTKADNEEGDISIDWEIATDDSFDNIVDSGNLIASATSDYTLSVEVSGLSANTAYYYRFRNTRTDVSSPIGQSKTLPAGAEASSVKLAVVSCANFQAGLFNVYGAVAESDADVVVHLGDYIYEYAIGGYGTTAETASLGREHTPDKETIALEDYRERYRQYRSDPQLQLAHQLKPFICVWDDHEITNDAH